MSAARKALEALEDLRAKATRGTWSRKPHTNRRGTTVAVCGADRRVTSICRQSADGTVDRANADLIALAVNLSAPLAAVVRAAMEEREAIRSELEGSPFGGPVDLFNGSAAKARRALDSALDAFNAAAAAQGFQP